MEFHSLVQWHRGVGGWGGGCVPGDLAVNLRDAEISPSNLFLISGAWSVSFTLRDRARLRTLVILAGVAVLIPVGDPCFGCLPSPAIFDLASPLRCPLATWAAGFYSTFFCFIFFFWTKLAILVIWLLDHTHIFHLICLTGIENVALWFTYVSVVGEVRIWSLFWLSNLLNWAWVFFYLFISYYISFLFCCINWFFTCYTCSLIVYVGCWKWRNFLSFFFNFL